MKSDWRYPIYEVLRHLHRNLDRSVPLEEAAEQAAYSPYCFHRRFREQVGETVGDVGRRLRLEKAAHLLRHSKLEVGEIAVECGYMAVEAFNRSFKKAYGMSPSELRQTKIPQLQIAGASGLHYKPGSPECIDIPLPLGDLEMSINIVQMKPLRLLSMRGTGDYWGMPEMWQRFIKYLGEHNLHRPDAWYMSVFHDHNESTPAEHKRWDVSITIPDGVEAPDDQAFVQIIPGGEYVIYTFRGDNEGIGPAWDHFRATWFKENRYKLKSGLPSLEWYRTGPQTPMEHLLTDLCDPIEPDPTGSPVETTWPSGS